MAIAEKDYALGGRGNSSTRKTKGYEISVVDKKKDMIYFSKTIM